MIRGDARHGSGRETSFGRRLRVGAVGTVAIGGAIFMGGAATLITASAHSFGTPATIPIMQGGNVVGSAILKDSALMASNVTKDRWVDFFLWAPGSNCTGAANILFTESDHPAVDGVSTVTTVGSYKPTAVGTYQWTADIRDPKTGVIEAGPTKCGDEPATLVKTSPAINTTASSGGIVGTTLSDVATVTGVVAPTGTVTFQLFSDLATCQAGSPVLFTSAGRPLSATAPFKATSGTFPTTGVGTFQWVATFSGDANNAAVSSTCGSEPVKISQAGPSISTTAGSGGTVPVDVTDTATVSGGVNPTGTVTFTLYPSAADCTAGTNAVGTPSTVTLSGGKATSAPIHLTAAGTYQWRAKYNGDANNASVSSNCGDEPVVATSTSPSPTPSGVGGINIPNTGGTGSLTGVTIGGFLLLGGLGVALAGSILPRRRRRSAP